MIIALTGLHRAGKTTITSRMQEEFNFQVIKKIDLLEKEYKKEATSLDFESWMQKSYQNDAYAFSKRLFANIPLNQKTVIDALYNANEWQALKDMYKKHAMLINVVTPQDVIEKRCVNDDNHKNIKEANDRRIKFFHIGNNNSSHSKCLLAEADWSLSGLDTKENFINNFKSILKYYSERNFDIAMYNKLKNRTK